MKLTYVLVAIMVTGSGALGASIWQAAAQEQIRSANKSGDAGQASAQAKVPTPDEYANHVGHGAKIIKPGELILASRRIQCGTRLAVPTVLDPTLDDVAAAYPNFIIIHPIRIAKRDPEVQWWIYKQSCGYILYGFDPGVADCFAIEQGKREGWLNGHALEKICKYMSAAEGDEHHLPGPQRCEAMRKCYAKAGAAK